MATGLFSRQAPIGLTIPRWATLAVAAPAANYGSDQHESASSLVRSLVEGLATIGVQGVTVVLSEACHPRMASTTGAAIEACRTARPYFRGAVCDATFAAHLADQPLGAVLHVRAAIEQDAAVPPLEFGLLDLPPSPDPAILLDLQTTLVGRTRRPAALLAELYSDGQRAQLENPWRRGGPLWGPDAHGYHACRGPGWTLLQEAAVLLALNVLSKPARYEDGTFLFAQEYLDEVVALAANERGLRPRWVEREAAPEARRGAAA